MAYIDYEYYKNLTGENSVSELDFNRLVFDACRKIDVMTTGADSVKKLKVAFPTEEESIETVKRCVVAVVDIMDQIEKAEENAKNAGGYVTREDGSLQGKVVSSVSAGSETIHYAVGNSTGSSTLIDKALSDKTLQDKLFRDTISEYLSGVTDANGVNLLYMGRYPYRVR